jgi:hypothetical protein
MIRFLAPKNKSQPPQPLLQSAPIVCKRQLHTFQQRKLRVRGLVVTPFPCFPAYFVVAALPQLHGSLASRIMLELKYWTRSETYTLIGAAVFYLICYGLSKALSPRLFSSYNKLPRAQRSEWNSRCVAIFPLFPPHVNFSSLFFLGRDRFWLRTSFTSHQNPCPYDKNRKLFILEQGIH